MHTIRCSDGYIPLEIQEWNKIRNHISSIQPSIPIYFPCSIKQARIILSLLIQGMNPDLISDHELFPICKALSLNSIMDFSWLIKDHYKITYMDQSDNDVERDYLALYYQSIIPPSSLVFEITEELDFYRPVYPILYSDDEQIKPTDTICYAMPFLSEYIGELWVVGEAIVHSIHKKAIHRYDYYFSCSKERIKVMIDEIISYLSLTDCEIYYVYDEVHAIQYLSLIHISEPTRPY